MHYSTNISSAYIQSFIGEKQWIYQAKSDATFMDKNLSNWCMAFVLSICTWNLSYSHSSFQITLFPMHYSTNISSAYVQSFIGKKKNLSS